MPAAQASGDLRDQRVPNECRKRAHIQRLKEASALQAQQIITSREPRERLHGIISTLDWAAALDMHAQADTSLFKTAEGSCNSRGGQGPHTCYVCS